MLDRTKRIPPFLPAWNLTARRLERFGCDYPRIESDEQADIGKLQLSTEIAQHGVPEFETVRTAAAGPGIGLAPVGDGALDLRLRPALARHASGLFGEFLLERLRRIMSRGENSAAIAMPARRQILALTVTQHAADRGIVDRSRGATVPFHDGANRIFILGGRDQRNEVAHASILAAQRKWLQLGG